MSRISFPAYTERVQELKREMFRLKDELKDQNQFQDELPRDDV